MPKKILNSEYTFWAKYIIVASICSIDIFFTIYYQNQIYWIEKNEIGKILIWHNQKNHTTDVSMFVAIKTFCNFMALAIWKRTYIANKKMGIVVGIALVLFQLWLLCFLLFA